MPVAEQLRATRQRATFENFHPQKRPTHEARTVARHDDRLLTDEAALRVTNRALYIRDFHYEAALVDVRSVHRRTGFDAPRFVRRVIADGRTRGDEHLPHATEFLFQTNDVVTDHTQKIAATNVAHAARAEGAVHVHELAEVGDRFADCGFDHCFCVRSGEVHLAKCLRDIAEFDRFGD